MEGDASDTAEDGDADDYEEATKGNLDAAGRPGRQFGGRRGALEGPSRRTEKQEK